MSKEHFNGNSRPIGPIILRLSPLAIIILMGSFLTFNSEPIEVYGRWGQKSFGFGMVFIAVCEMLSYQKRLQTNIQPSSPAPSDKTKYNQMTVIIGMIVFCVLLGYMLAIRNKK